MTFLGFFICRSNQQRSFYWLLYFSIIFLLLTTSIALSKDLILEEGANIVFNPDDVTISSTGETLLVKVGITAGVDLEVDAVDLVLKTLNPSLLRLENVKDISSFEQKLADLTFNAQGDVSISLATFGASLTGNIALLELEYRYLGDAGTSASVITTKASEISGKIKGKIADLTGKLGTLTISIKEKDTNEAVPLIPIINYLLSE